MNAWRIPEDVVFRELDGEGVLLNLATGIYFGLNPTGTIVWQLLNEGKPDGEIVSALVAEFEVTEDIAAADVKILIEELAAKGLLGPA